MNLRQEILSKLEIDMETGLAAVQLFLIRMEKYTETTAVKVSPKTAGNVFNIMIAAEKIAKNLIIESK